LEFLTDLVGKRTWTLLYKASKDGFSASTFHMKC